ncbi:flagellar basal body-associated protein FliL [Bacillus coahuilensis m2-6]|uniref:Flagellar protein FliL n=1 Tax=Bacillus coahuilensis p1.1.43 TaxID=1150625 RepID=A0A147K9L1_9BACI|nr:flagellar basal body-associated protein FliL [Bacillus coahuilensis]KUP07116.1 flagellar basal body-associated protein FliL [Bacillus coahuilensis p1.1.43]KUP08673.1 flagellar basal body-associated protein FliL [Bacillus coahuilensis m2-6]
MKVNNKLVRMMLIILVLITLLGAVTFVVLWKLSDNGEAAESEPSIDEILEYSVDIPELTTNLLSNNDFIRISFKIQTDSKKAKEELEKRNFQVNDIIIEEMSELTSDEIRGKDGKRNIEDTIKTKLNSLMQEGKIEKVYITSWVIQ